MNYIYKCKFTSQIEAHTVLNQEGNPGWLDSLETIVEIGTIVKPAEFDEEGNQIATSQVLEGWHVDILAHDLIDELRPYCLDHAPNNPVHGYGWAGDEFILVLKENALN